MAVADVGYVGYGIEVTEGDLAAPTIFLPANSFSVDSTNDYITPSQLRGSRDKSIKMSSPYSISGTMGMELPPTGVGPLLISALSAKGGVTSAYTSAYGPGAYMHTIVPGASSSTFAFETSAADILVMRYGGIRVNTLEIAATFGEIVTASFGLEGTTRAKQGGPAAETYDGINPFHFTGVEVKKDGTQLANVQSFTFNTNNNIDRRGTLRKTRAYSRTLLGARDVGLSLTMDFIDTAAYDLFLAETEFALTLNFEGDYLNGSAGQRYQLLIYMPRVTYNTVNAPLNAGDFITQDVECMVIKPLSAAAILTAWLINKEVTLLGAS